MVTPQGSVLSGRRHSTSIPCRSGDPDAWWPDRKAIDSPATLEAVAACWSCSAWEACLSYALAADERGGVWGGLLAEERRALRLPLAG